MADLVPLDSSALETALPSLPGWQHEGDALVRVFTFEDFKAAIGAIVRIGFEAEQLDHHPDLHNVYNRLTVRLTTHDAGDRVTARDLALAHRIDAALTA